MTKCYCLKWDFLSIVSDLTTFTFGVFLQHISRKILSIIFSGFLSGIKSIFLSLTPYGLDNKVIGDNVLAMDIARAWIHYRQTIVLHWGLLGTQHFYSSSGCSKFSIFCGWRRWDFWFSQAPCQWYSQRSRFPCDDTRPEHFIKINCNAICPTIKWVYMYISM